MKAHEQFNAVRNIGHDWMVICQCGWHVTRPTLTDADAMHRAHVKDVRDQREGLGAES